MINETGFIDCKDYDNDGDIDFIVTGVSDYYPRTAIYQNDNAVFSNINASVAQLKFSTAVFADYDNDGDLDFAISGETDNLADYKFIIYRNDGNNTFTDINAPLGDIRGHISWGDFDNDGDLDILISGGHNYNEPITKIYSNNGNDQFIDSQIGLSQINGKSFFLDYDNDNDLDILIAGNKGIYPNTSSAIKILRNDSSATFAEIDLQIHSQYGELAAGDFDNDGKVDFAISGPDQLNSYNYSSRIYRNTFSTNIFTFNSDKNITMEIRSLTFAQRIASLLRYLMLTG